MSDRGHGNSNNNNKVKLKSTGFIRIVKAFRYSFKGYRWAFIRESAVRQETFVLGVAVVVSFILGKNYLQYILMISSILLVIIIELINSAIEAVVDRIGLERHELSGCAKDMGSCAVFFAIIIALVVWIGIILHNYPVLNPILRLSHT